MSEAPANWLPPVPADEAACVRGLLADLQWPEEAARRIDARARRLVEAVRARRLGEGLDAFLHAYGLSTQEGVLLMCIAEALLRIPDEGTRERLIRDKLAAADWEQHLGRSSSVLVNASTWALMLTGRLVRLHDEAGQGVAAAIRRLVVRLGEPVVREAVTQAMRILGRQFVMARTIERGIERARPLQQRGWRFSYDMLGESARTMHDADRYAAGYAHAIAAIGAAHRGTASDPRSAPGISVKLSALHPRFEDAQIARVREELVPRVAALAQAAAKAGIGLTIDAEESERLAPTLEVIEALASDPRLAGWDGLGAVVQTYLRVAPAVLDRLAETARRHGRRLLLRLVKGAYWDAEIKRAQELGLDTYPVYTRKPSTDVSYLACARQVLAAPDAFFPQFATHNAHTVAAVLELASNSRDLEFQRLHGMGDALYEELAEREDPVAVRIYAPVGAHEDLLAYLVRRLLENGANSSFVNRLQDNRLPVGAIVADPVGRVRSFAEIANPRIPLPRVMYLPERLHARGIDLADRRAVAALAQQMTAADADSPAAAPIVGGDRRVGAAQRRVVSPADLDRTVGRASDATAADLEDAVVAASRAAADWRATPVARRSAALDRAADLLEAEMPQLSTLLVREAGKTIADALSEVREAADFCRYYAARARLDCQQALTLPLPATTTPPVAVNAGGCVFACISPWNFPLAIFIGQVTAALVAGNAVIAKPAEQTPLIADRAIRLLHRAGIPPQVLHLLPGDGGRVGAALVADPRVDGVVFTGSIDTARSINRALAARTATSAAPPVLIAETGGQNAMIVDSSALPEQVTRDALASAFRSAGQRCSALRLLFVQDDVAPKIIAMLVGAMDELRVGDPSLLATDVGPVIDDAARTMLEAHIAGLRAHARLLARAPLRPETRQGLYVAPALIEIDTLERLQGEVFGPVLHVIRWQANRLPQVIEAIEATGFGLTLGVQTRIDDTRRFIFERTTAGNVYVNRNQIGAVVGVQPFGGGGLSGTGPKAGGPAYLHRMAACSSAAARPAPDAGRDAGNAGEAVIAARVLSRTALQDSLAAAVAAGMAWQTRTADERADLLERAARQLTPGAAPAEWGAAVRSAAAHLRAHWVQPLPLPGPTGERNELSVRPLGVLAVLIEGAAPAEAEVFAVAAALAAGNSVVLWSTARSPAMTALMQSLASAGLPGGLLGEPAAGDDASPADLLSDPRLAGAIVAGEPGVIGAVACRLAARDGAILPLIPAPATPGAEPAATAAWFERLVHERTLTIDTTASGGNAALLSLDEEA